MDRQGECALALGAEELRQQLSEASAFIGVCVVQRLLRAVQELCGQAFGEGFQDRLYVLAFGQQLARALQLGTAITRAVGDAVKVSGTFSANGAWQQSFAA